MKKKNLQKQKETEKTEINNTNNFLAMPRDAHTQTDIEYTSSIGTPTPPTPQNLTPTPFTNSIQTPVSTTPLLARIKQLQEKQDRQQQQQQQTLSGSPTPNTYSQNNSPETKPQKISPKSELNRKPKVLIVDDNQINRYFEINQICFDSKKNRKLKHIRKTYIHIPTHNKHSFIHT